MVDILACKRLEASLTRPMKAGSSELSASCLATIRTRLAKRAMCDVPSTRFCGSWRPMASSHSPVHRRINSSANHQIHVIIDLTCRDCIVFTRKTKFLTHFHLEKPNNSFKTKILMNFDVGN